VRRLIQIERNRSLTILLHALAWEYAEPTGKLIDGSTIAKAQEFEELHRVLDPKSGDQSSATYHAAWELAQHMVEKGYARWKPRVSEESIRKEIESWRIEMYVDKMFLNGQKVIIGQKRWCATPRNYSQLLMSLLLSTPHASAAFHSKFFPR
jgi:hypothetical protein